MLFLLRAQLPKWKKEFVLNSITAKSRSVVFVGSGSASSRIPICEVLLCTPRFLDSSLPGTLAAAGDLSAPGRHGCDSDSLILPTAFPMPLLSPVEAWASGRSSEMVSEPWPTWKSWRKAVNGFSEGTPFSCLLLRCHIFRGKPRDRTLSPHVPLS